METKPCSAEQARERELERALRLLRSGRNAASVGEALSRRLTNKLLHASIRALRASGAG
jgi:glutamyl-tRNA reductase